MQGLMMDMPLLISSILQHADRHHGDTEIVSRREARVPFKDRSGQWLD